MRINNNMMAMNTSRQMNVVGGNQAKSMEKLSSGYRINRAGDDAAGLAISEKMRAQVRGLNQASRNAQDGISLIQTAEGALNETHAILQRMRELSVQSSNDTNVNVDRTSIQDEITQLSSEIDRIGNTTEFNTQALLKGDGKANLAATGIATATGTLANGTTTHTEATIDITMADAQTAAGLAGGDMVLSLNGETLNIKFEATADNTLAADGGASYKTDSAKSDEATVYVNEDASNEVADTLLAAATKDAIQQAINANDKLKGNYTVSVTGADVTITAVSEANGGDSYGNKGYIGAVANVTATAGAVAADIGATATTAATHTMDVSSIDTQAEAKALVGQGFTVGDKQYVFYNANDGAYTGEGTGVNISNAIEAGAGANDEALATAIAAQVKGDGFTAAVAAGNTVTFTATATGADGNGTVSFEDGGVQKDFKAEFQIGANEGQTMAVSIADMRSESLGIDKIDLTSRDSAKAATTTINDAIEKVSSQRSSLGAVQNRLEHTIKNLDTSAENLQAAESRIRDVDMAKEMMEFTKNNILSQAAQSMLAQANQAPQGVLQLLR